MTKERATACVHRPADFHDFAVEGCRMRIDGRAGVAILDGSR
jgi:hypothetical protein